MDKRHTQINIESLRHLHEDFKEREKTCDSIEQSEAVTFPPPVAKSARPRRETTFPGGRQPQLARIPVNARRAVRVVSPWSSYEEIHSLRLGIDFWVTYAERRAFPYEEYSIRHFPGTLDEDKLQILQKIRHPNFVTVVDIFQFEETTHVVFEHKPISLHD